MITQEIVDTRFSRVYRQRDKLTLETLSRLIGRKLFRDQMHRDAEVQARVEVNTYIGGRLEIKLDGEIVLIFHPITYSLDDMSMRYEVLK